MLLNKTKSDPYVVYYAARGIASHAKNKSDDGQCSGGASRPIAVSDVDRESHEVSPKTVETRGMSRATAISTRVLQASGMWAAQSRHARRIAERAEQLARRTSLKNMTNAHSKLRIALPYGIALLTSLAAVYLTSAATASFTRQLTELWLVASAVTMLLNLLVMMPVTAMINACIKHKLERPTGKHLRVMLHAAQKGQIKDAEWYAADAKDQRSLPGDYNPEHNPLADMMENTAGGIIPCMFLQNTQ